MFEPGENIRAAILGEGLLTGAVMGIYYDFFRIIRRIIRCRYANIVGQDIFFWVTSAFFVFFTMIKLNGGQVRILFVLMVLAGWGFYMLSVGAVVMLLVEWGIKVFKIVFARLHNIVTSECKKRAEKHAVMQKTKKSG